MVPFVKEQMIRDFKLQPFTFKFDETTTNQVKKQYGYAQFWSNEKKEIVNRLLLLIIPLLVNNTIRLLIPIVVNSTSVVIIIKYHIFVNNTSSNYTKIKFRSYFLGYSSNGNCVITLLDRLTNESHNYNKELYPVKTLIVLGFDVPQS